MRHPAAVNIVCKMIDSLESGTNGEMFNTRQIFKINVINRQRVRVIQRCIAIHQIDERTANALNRGDAQFHHACFALNRLCPAVQRFCISRRSIFNPKRHPARRSAMFLGEISGGTAGFVIGDQVNLALPPQMHIFGPMLRHAGKAHAGKHRF